MNKKAQAPEKMLFYLGFGVMYTLIFFILIILLSSYMSNTTQFPAWLEQSIYTERFINSPSCFTYKDQDTGRSSPGVIDITRFTEENLNNCYITSRAEASQDTPTPQDATSISDTPRFSQLKNIGFKLTIVIQGQDIPPIKTANWEDSTDRILVKDIFIMQNSIIKKAKLKIEVQDVE